MENKERDKWDDAIQSKLLDFEVDPMPSDWEAIADQLPKQAPVIPLRRSVRYWAAAAVISLLVITGGIYLYDNQIEAPVAHDLSQPAVPRPEEAQVEEARIEEMAPVEATPVETPTTPVVLAQATVPVVPQTYTRSVEETEEEVDCTQEEAIAVASVAEEEEQPKATTPSRTSVAVKRSSGFRSASSRSTKANENETPRPRRWGIGMGGGSFSAGTSQWTPSYVTNSSFLRSENLTMLNAFDADKGEMAKTDIHHKTPIGFGLSVSYALTNRLYLQSGLTYSYLRSEWSTNNTYHVDNDQRLHFLGIPLSLAFKIAEWNKFMFYTSAGAMTEVNVAGKRKMNLYSDDVKILSTSEHIRMKEWLWSVNARAGVSYPIIRFVSAFAEVGASYYFDNGSEIETVHSEKPFNVSLQLGFRLGF